MKDMKMMNKMMIRAVGVLIVCLLPLVAFAQQDWRSTSTMTGSGSAYMPEVTSVGSAEASEMATTTAGSPAKAPGGPRKDIITPSNPGSQSNESPAGDAVLPLALMALTFAGVVYFRKRKARV